MPYVTSQKTRTGMKIFKNNSLNSQIEMFKSRKKKQYHASLTWKYFSYAFITQIISFQDVCLVFEFRLNIFIWKAARFISLPTRRALPSLAIASICFSLIYLDYSHTQKWKKEVETQKELIEKAKATA